MTLQNCAFDLFLPICVTLATSFFTSHSHQSICRNKFNINNFVNVMSMWWRWLRTNNNLQSICSTYDSARAHFSLYFSFAIFFFRSFVHSFFSPVNSLSTTFSLLSTRFYFRAVCLVASFILFTGDLQLLRLQPRLDSNRCNVMYSVLPTTKRNGVRKCTSIFIVRMHVCCCCQCFVSFFFFSSRSRFSQKRDNATTEVMTKQKRKKR